MPEPEYDMTGLLTPCEFCGKCLLASVEDEECHCCYRCHVLEAALRDCAVNEDNPDTCGVCGQHFTECDADQRVRGEATEAACAGARARETLRPRG